MTPLLDNVQALLDDPQWQPTLPRPLCPICGHGRSHPHVIAIYVVLCRMVRRQWSPADWEFLRTHTAHTALAHLVD